MSRSWINVLAGAALLMSGGATWYFWPQPAPIVSVTPPPVRPVTPVAQDTAPLQDWENEFSLTTVFRGNGSTHLHATATNKSSTPLTEELKAGQVFENGKNRVILLADAKLQAAPGATAEAELSTAALRSTNSIGEGEYKKSFARYSKLSPLIEYLESHPHVSADARQTAVLAIIEDLPLEAFAKFTRLHPDPRAEAAGAKFKIETREIIEALTVLHDAGIDETHLALGSDHQLAVEAMVNPASHEAAVAYYGIAQEWSWWKNQLLAGDRSLRHYALYGIGRYYPVVALQMMPRWALERHLQPIVRRSAINAIGATQRPEAIGVLNFVADHLENEPELRAVAFRAIEYVKQNAAPIEGNGPILSLITR